MTQADNQIKIVSVGRVQTEVLDYLTFVMADSFGAPCEVLDARIATRFAYSSKRRQYDSNQILQELLKLEFGTDCKVLGVTEVDLFVPIFTFVFGLAQVGGKAALISTCRLRQEFYGLPQDDNLFLLRCEKEAAHELGHAHGLLHCPSDQCVMHFSNSIEQVDMKSATLCSACYPTLYEERPLVGADASSMTRPV